MRVGIRPARDRCQTTHRFFFAELLALFKEFTGLFGSLHEGDQVEEKSKSRFHAQYGWLDVVDTLANGDGTKWDYYLSLDVIEIFNRLAFYKAKNAEQLKQQNGKVGRH